MQGILNPGTFVKLNPGNLNSVGGLVLISGEDKKKLQTYIQSADIDRNSFGCIISYDVDTSEYKIRWLNIKNNRATRNLDKKYMKYFISVNQIDVPSQVTFMLTERSVPAGGVLKQQVLPELPINPFSFGAVVGSPGNAEIMTDSM